MISILRTLVLRVFKSVVGNVRFIAIFYVTLIFNTACYASGVGFKDSVFQKATPIVAFSGPDENESREFSQLDRLAEQAWLVSEAGSEFTFEYLNRYVGSQPEAGILKAKAKDAIDKLIDINNFVGALRPDGLFQLPVGFKKQVNNTIVTIAIAQVKFETGYAELTAFARIDIPQEPKQLYFGLEGIKLTYDGGIVGDAKLVLLGDIPIRVSGGSSALILKGGNSLRQSGATQSKTYLAFDCNGFKELGIAADIEFPRSLLIPMDARGKPESNPDKRVKGSFATVVSDWSDILVEISIPEFSIPQLKDIVFHLNGVTLDLSDLRNAPSIVYPRNYEQNYMVPSNPQLWRGVYARAVRVTLPPQFKDKSDSTRRISYMASNLLIDNNGLSGIFAAKNILPLSKGTASGWKLSVDEMSISLEANSITGASFKGSVSLPVAEKDTFAYQAVIMPDQYQLCVTTQKKFDFTLWKAQVELDPNSTITLRMTEQNFEPEAMLHGRMSLAISKDEKSEKPLAKFTELKFQSLHIMPKAPYLEVEYFGYEGEVKFANFPLSLENIGVSVGGGEAALAFTVKLNLMEEQIAGKARVEVMGKFQRESYGDQSWKYDGTRLSSIAIAANISGSLKIMGSLEIFEKDSLYGDGIAGMIAATFIPIKLEVKSRAIFGSGDFRFWFIDGSVAYGDGIPVLGPLRIHGFGGGAFYHMKRNTNKAISRAEFIPDINTEFGIKSAVLFNVATRSLLDGEASFEIAFNKKFGINYIGFYGDARFMGQIPGTENIQAYVQEKREQFHEYEQAYLSDNPELAKRLEKMKVNQPTEAARVLSEDIDKLGSESSIYGHVGMTMDFNTRTFHATYDVYVHAAGGLLKGTGAKNRAGWSVMHISPDEWYVHMGTPVDRIGIQFGLGSFSLKTGGYFMAGSTVLDSPPPPQAVAEILGVDAERLNYMRDLNALKDGRGFAYGTNFSVSTGDITFLMLYANFRAGAGFDMMLRDYGNAHCAGSSSPIGIDGWFANGQAYAYLQGEVGVSVRIFGIKKKFSVLQGGSAVLLQAKLPNPTSFKGYLAVRVDVLGGLISGSFRMKISLGNDCQIVYDSGSPLQLSVISDLKPIDQSKEVDVFAAPQAAFNMRLEQPFYVDDENGTKTYRIQLEEFSVYDKDQKVPGSIVWNYNHDIVTFYSTEVLPPQKTLRAIVKVNFEIKQGETWQLVMDQGKKASEMKEVSFTTGIAPDNIPLSNLAHTYPVVNQKNYYRDESTSGYVQLKRGQSYLFSPEWKYELRIGKDEKLYEAQPVNYDVAERRIKFTLSKLDLSSSYTVGLMAVPLGRTTGAVVANPEQLIKAEEGELTIRNNQASDVIQDGLGKSLLAYSFTTSKHALFADKIKALSIREPYIGKVSTDVINLQPLVASYEPFDLPEIAGTEFTGLMPLVKPGALPQDSYYLQDIHPLLYKDYPVAEGIRITNRDTTTLGFYPARSLPVHTYYLTALELNEINPNMGNRLPYIYDLTRIYHRDFIDLQAQIVNRFLGTSQQQQYAYIIMHSYPMMRYGAYKVNLQYVLPNGEKGSSAVFDYFNPIK